MKNECFKGDAYFYVDDSVIYIQAALEKKIFDERIKKLNEEVAKWCRKSNEASSDIEKYVPINYLDFHKKINYEIAFYEEGKSVFTPIDFADTQYGAIGDLARSVSMTSNLSLNIDEIDDQVSLEKLKALDQIITTEIKGVERARTKRR